MAQPTTKQSSSDKTSDVQKQKNLSKVSSGADKKVRDKAYNDYVESITPKHNLAANMAKAFVMGGSICCIGQFILNICKSLGLDKEMSGSWCSILLILLSVILTGLNLYPSLANWGRCRCARADHRICQRCCGTGDRVSERGTGLWNRL